MVDDDRNHDASRMALLFTGGLDTTLEVVERLEQYDGIDLLTFDNGHCINLRGARRRVRELREHLGASHIRHVEFYTADLIQKLLADADTIWREYRSPLIFDLACKMSSVAELIRHARENGITDLSDGASANQTEIFLQQPEFSVHAVHLAEAYGCRFLHPIRFDWSRERKQQLLVEKGFAPGIPDLEKLHIGSHLAHQPFCLRGIATFFFTSPTRHLAPVKRYAMSTDQAIELWQRLLPIAREYLDRRLSR